ncbi:MAG: helix-turn-helix domain-containing protein [Firmicutes bacterium]|nr:helix-turn-helix domain-containing protein [Bacillota bacterium]
MSYGKVIEKIRKEKNMSQRAFGDLVQLDHTYIGQLEKEIAKGKPLNPTITTLKQICDRSGYSFKEFLEEAGYI